MAAARVAVLKGLQGGSKAGGRQLSPEEQRDQLEALKAEMGVV